MKDTETSWDVQTKGTSEEHVRQKNISAEQISLEGCCLEPWEGVQENRQLGQG